jgi:YD repeat-containing protein
MFIIGDVEHFSWVALVLANGSQIRYGRVSPGKGFADAVFEDRASPGKFLGSRISWNQYGSWTVALRDGTEFTVQGCGAKSKPGQCAVSEVKNAQGERLTVQRDRDGNIQRITSPHGHFLSVANDSEGHITRVKDDSQRWVTYRYDDRGCLVEARSWRGDQQKFAYDNQFNMTFVHEKGPRTKRTEAYNFTISNTYDEQNRFKRQKISTGEAYSAKYITDSNGHVRENDVHGPAGLSRYFFNEAGYETREEFRPSVGPGWTLERVYDANSNAAVEAILRCQTAKIRLPLELDTRLGEAGESRITYLAEICERAEKKLRSEGKPTSGNEQ